MRSVRWTIIIAARVLFHLDYISWNEIIATHVLRESSRYKAVSNFFPKLDVSGLSSLRLEQLVPRSRSIYFFKKYRLLSPKSTALDFIKRLSLNRRRVVRPFTRQGGLNGDDKQITYRYGLGDRGISKWCRRICQKLLKRHQRDLDKCSYRICLSTG